MIQRASRFSIERREDAVNERDFSSAVAKKMAEHMDRMFLKALGQTTTFVQPQETTLNAKDMLRSCEQMLRNFRREQITFVVEFSHQGPIISHDTPCDGKRIEMNFVQAQELHRQWPLKLAKVLTTMSAEFVPASGVFNEFIPSVLPMPPFELPRECEHSETFLANVADGSKVAICRECGKVQR
jgi:hypothetical protein